MAIAGSPKKMAQDIADGFFMLSPAMLRGYSPVDIKTILSNIDLVSRDIRGQQVPLEDVMALKAKNMKLSRLNQASVLIRSHCKKARIPI